MTSNNNNLSLHSATSQRLQSWMQETLSFRDRQRGAEVAMQGVSEALQYSSYILHMWTSYDKNSAENRLYISTVLDSFSIPNFYIRKHRPHGHRFGKSQGCKDYFTANQLAKKCRKKKYDNIHDRYIRDKTFRKAMIEVGRSEQMIKEMDKLASEDHTKPKGRDWILPWQLVDPHECGTLRFSTHKVRTWIQKYVVNNATPEASRWQKETRNIDTKFLILVFLALAFKLVGVWFWALTSKDGMTTNSTGQPVPWWFDIYLRKESQRAEEFRIFIVNKSVTADGSLLSPTGGVKGIYPAPDIHEHFTIHTWLRQTAYIFTHNFNNLEHIANNCMSDMTHTDVTTAHHLSAMRGV